MKRLIKGAVVAVLLVVLGVGAYGLNYLKRLAPLPSGFVSHAVCSGVFVAGRDFDEVLAHDVSALQRRLTSTEVDGNVVTTTFGLWPIGHESKTAYRPGLGCSRLGDGSVEDLQGPEFLARDLPEQWMQDNPWPDLVVDPEGVDTTALKAALDSAFSDDAENYEERQNTRAIVVFHKNQLIAERYAEGFAPEVPLNSWSMTKSVTSALVGILVGKGQIDLAAPSGVEGWGDPDDLRSQVTVGHLLHMTSGLEFNEGYENDPISDVNYMLMDARDLPAFAAQYPVTAEPGSRWAYQTASPVLLGRVMRDSFTSEEAYHHFPQKSFSTSWGCVTPTTRWTAAEHMLAARLCTPRPGTGRVLGRCT